MLIPFHLAVGVAAMLAFAGQASGMQIQRFAFIVGQNDGGFKKQKLKYATSDAFSMAQTMADLGGVAGGDSMLVANPSRAEFFNRMTQMQAVIRKRRVALKRSELFFYYSGHSDDEGLLLKGEKITYPELRERIRLVSADLSIIVLDSCASGNLTRIKGGHRAAPFLNEALSKLKGYVALTSSSSHEVAQESDRIKGSYFTHYLVSGLRGAADLSLDNRVTLNEAYQYAYNQTLARTEKTVSGAQHPSYSIQLTGSGELVMTDMRRVSAKVVFDKNILGRIFIRDTKDRIVAEVDKITAKPMAIGLEAGDYSIVWLSDRRIGRADVKLAHNQFSEVRMADFSPIEAESSITRGGASIEETVDDEDLVHVPTEFSIVPNLSTSVAPVGRTTNNFSMSLLYAQPVKVSGFAWSLLGGSDIRDSLKGVQLAPFFNRVGKSVEGVQLSAGYNSATTVDGVQLGALHNRTARLVGAQIGGYNHVESVDGLQIGAFNEAEQILGAQIGGLNRSGTKEGLQIGAVNLAPALELGVQIGGVNVAPGLKRGVQVGVLNETQVPFEGAQLGALNELKQLVGFQAGAVNSSDAVDGVQIGGLGNRAGKMQGVQVAFANVASEMVGAQIGAVNMVSAIDGMQMGLINYGAGKESVTFGILNLPRAGELRLSYAIDGRAMHHLALKYGTRYTYSFLEYSEKPESQTHIQGKSFGLGGDVVYEKLSFNVEALITRLDRSTLISNHGIWLAKGRIGPRYRPASWLGVFSQLSASVNLTGRTDYFSTDDYDKSLSLGALAGIEWVI